MRHAAALLVHRDRFAALLDHPLQHLGDEGVVLGRRCGGAQLDVAILERREDQADGGGAGLVAGLHGGDLGGFYRVANHGPVRVERESDAIAARFGF